jgi:hypothetical protein
MYFINNFSLVFSFQLNRAYVYSFPTPDAMLNASLGIFLPPDATEEWTGALGGGLSTMYAPDREFMSRIIHVQLSMVMALCCLFNVSQGSVVMKMSPEGRKSSNIARAHRIAGQTLGVCCVPWTIGMGYTLFIHGMMPFGPVVETADKLAFLVCAVSFPAGIWYASLGKFQAHRACMIWGTASLFHIPFQRFLWRLAVIYAGSIEAFRHLGNYFMTVDGAVILSGITSFSMAYYYTMGTVKDWSLSKSTSKFKAA